jgi:hypothetical protein
VEAALATAAQQAAQEVHQLVVLPPAVRAEQLAQGARQLVQAAAARVAVARVGQLVK